MNKSLLAATVLAIALSACSKKEEVAATQPALAPAVTPAVAPAATPAAEQAAPANLSAQANVVPPAPTGETGAR